MRAFLFHVRPERRVYLLYESMELHTVCMYVCMYVCMHGNQRNILYGALNKGLRRAVRGAPQVCALQVEPSTTCRKLPRKMTMWAPSEPCALPAKLQLFHHPTHGF